MISFVIHKRFLPALVHILLICVTNWEYAEALLLYCEIRWLSLGKAICDWVASWNSSFFSLHRLSFLLERMPGKLAIAHVLRFHNYLKSTWDIFPKMKKVNLSLNRKQLTGFLLMIKVEPFLKNKILESLRQLLSSYRFLIVKFFWWDWWWYYMIWDIV